MRLSVIICAVGIMFSACSSFNPPNLELQIAGSKIAADQVDSLEDLGPLELASDYLGRAYILESVWSEGRRTAWRISRKSKDSDWEIVVETDNRPIDDFEMRIRSGSSDLFIGRCTRVQVDDGGGLGPFRFGPFRLYQHLEGEGLVEVSDRYWGDLPIDDLSLLGLTDCDFNWAIDPEGALVLATPQHVWKVHEGQIEALVADLVAATGEFAPVGECDRYAPGMKINAAGDVLLFYRGYYCGYQLKLRADGFLLSGTNVRPILYLENNQSIFDASIGPDGAGYFLIYETPTDDSSEGVYHGIRATDAATSHFFTVDSNINGGFDFISVSGQGRMYMTYGGGNMFAGFKSWLLGFPTESSILR